MRERAFGPDTEKDDGHVADCALRSEQMQQSIDTLANAVHCFRQVFQKSFINSKLAEGVPGVAQAEFDELELRVSRLQLSVSGKAMQTAMRDLSVDTYLPFIEKEMACPFTLLAAQHDKWRADIKAIIDRQPDKLAQKLRVEEATEAAHREKKSKNFSLRRNNKKADAPEVSADLARMRDLRAQADEMVRVLAQMGDNIKSLADAVCVLGALDRGKRSRVIEAFAQYMIVDQTVLHVLEERVIGDLTVSDGDEIKRLGELSIEKVVTRLTILEGGDKKLAKERLGRIYAGAEVWLTETLGAKTARAVLPPVWSLRPDTLNVLDEADAQHQRSRVMRRLVPQMVGLLDICGFKKARKRIIRMLMLKFV